MATAEYDLGYVQEALGVLENYLLSNDIFWNFTAEPPRGEPPFPALTLGGILLSARRLAALETTHALTPDQSLRWRDLDSQLGSFRQRWRTAWMQKAERSLNARLTQWRNFLEEYRAQPENHARRYAYEVRLRVMLDLLTAEVSSLPAHLVETLRSLDSVLRQSLQPGGFIWEKQLIPGFPQNQFWYLYGQLSAKARPDAE